MNKKLIGVLVAGAVAVMTMAALADSVLSWSDAGGARGTLTIDSATLTNCTLTGTITLSTTNFIPVSVFTNTASVPLTTNDVIVSGNTTNRMIFNKYGVRVSSTAL